MTSKSKTPPKADGELNLPSDVIAQLIPIVKFVNENIDDIHKKSNWKKLLADKGFADLMPPEIIDALYSTYEDGIDDRGLAFREQLPQDLIDAVFNEVELDELESLQEMRDAQDEQIRNLNATFPPYVAPGKETDDGSDDDGLGFTPDKASLFARFLMDDLGLSVFKD